MMDLPNKVANSAGSGIGRLIPLVTADAAENMAIDQSILDSVSISGVPVLRFYQWSEATLSMGYFQRFRTRSEHAASFPIRCVRRATGGGAIVHDQELTYSICLPVEPGKAWGRDTLYQQTHQAIADALACFGVHAVPFRLSGACIRTKEENSRFLCFQRRTEEDLVVSGYKVLGSAQRKTRTAVLQHGSLLIHASRYAPELPGIGELQSFSIPVQQLIEKIVINLSAGLNLDWNEGELTDHEKQMASKISQERFTNAAWTMRR